MTIDDPYLPDDATLVDKSYKEFKLDKIDEVNLNDIEKSLEHHKINSSNKEDMLDYLNKLLQKILEIKRLEYSYEGDNNLNINEYLSRIMLLKEKVERTR